MVVRIIADLIEAYLALLCVRIVLTWFPTSPWSRVARVTRALAAITDPVLVPIRRRLPAARIGNSAIDLSPLVVFFVLYIVLALLPR